LTPTGVGAAPVPSLHAAIHWLLDLLYWDIPLPEAPVTDKHVSLSERNRHICARYAAGETLEDIARDLGLSHQRVHQIIQRWC
jgi:DNA-binding NarL/FixJ family response regulator